MTFSERHVEADGIRLRYMEAGRGAPLVHLHESGALRLTPAHDLLSHHARVVALEMPGHAPEPVATLARAIESLGFDTFNLMGTSRAGATALRVTLQAPARVRALVLESPAAIDVELERRLPEITTPTLVVCGTADDASAPAMGRVCKALMPNGHLVFVYAAGRAIGHDRPDAFADVVGDFLERREAFVISRAPTVIHP